MKESEVELRTRGIRFGLAGLILAALFVFFAPLIPHHVALNCPVPSYGCPTPGDFGNYNSLGLAVFGWGAAYSFGATTYSPPLVNFVSGGELNSMSPFGALFSMVIPLIVASIGLLAPEIVGFSRAARAGLAGFGAAVLAFSIILLGSTLSPVVPPLALAGLALAYEGGALLLLGLRPASVGLTPPQSKQLSSPPR
jgi:hypothetical protein